MVMHLPDLSARAIGWFPKSEGLREVCKELRVGPDAVLVVDDNPGELAEIAGAVPGSQCLLAGDPTMTERALRLYPGLYRFSRSAEDLLRTRDVHAAKVRRQELASAADRDGYMRSLSLRLTFEVNPIAERRRLHELSQKTNQFNLALIRLTEAEVQNYLASSDRRAIGVWLQDRISDSGLVGAVFCKRVGLHLDVDEVVVSCRALGRGLEPAMVLESVRLAAKELGVSTVRFHYRPGPRNMPARDWLTAEAGPVPVDGGAVEMPFAPEQVQGRLAALPVELILAVSHARRAG
jgi:FkbH-like protein